MWIYRYGRHLFGTAAVRSGRTVFRNALAERSVVGSFGYYCNRLGIPIGYVIGTYYTSYSRFYLAGGFRRNNNDMFLYLENRKLELSAFEKKKNHFFVIFTLVHCTLQRVHASIGVFTLTDKTVEDFPFKMIVIFFLSPQV